MQAQSFNKISLITFGNLCSSFLRAYSLNYGLPKYKIFTFIGISGRVTLSFVIERDGSLTNIRVLSSPDKYLTDEAVRVVSSSPKWKPGLQRNKPARVIMNLPVMFQLRN